MKKRLLINTITSILLQVTAVICGFILPRLILQYYGSEINGLVQSITQFLGLIAFMELGIGAVIQSSLYKPLADKDEEKTSAIITSGNKFFQRLALILLVYIGVLICIYPFISSSDFSWLFTATLIAAMGVSSFSQYYFGITDGLLLNADQRGYVQYLAQIVTIIVNTAVCFVLIKINTSIQVVKLVTSLIYLCRPLFLRIYVNKKYRINRKAKYNQEPIKQKWNGIAQHVTSVVIDSTDNVVLTTCSSLSNVSIYSAYHNVVYGIKNVFMASTNGFLSALGDCYAKNDVDKMQKVFSLMDFLIHISTACLFTCTGVLIVPFIKVYTDGITDANYIQPVFAIILVLAHASHCIRLPYNTLIKACGHYKQTQLCYIIAAIINIVLSVIMVFFLGLTGVAIGTLCAMLFQTIWMVFYNSKHLINWPFKKFLKQIVIDILICGGIVGATFWIKLQSVSYFSWFLMALKVFGIAVLVTFLACLLFYRQNVKTLYLLLKTKISHKKA